MLACLHVRMYAYAYTYSVLFLLHMVVGSDASTRRALRMFLCYVSRMVVASDVSMLEVVARLQRRLTMHMVVASDTRTIMGCVMCVCVCVYLAFCLECALVCVCSMVKCTLSCCIHMVVYNSRGDLLVSLFSLLLLSVFY